MEIQAQDIDLESIAMEAPTLTLNLEFSHLYKGWGQTPMETMMTINVRLVLN